MAAPRPGETPVFAGEEKDTPPGGNDNPQFWNGWDEARYP
jgi:hypothetical protein